MAAGEDHAHRALHADLARQPVQAAGHRGEAHLRLRQCEGRVLRGDDEVAGQSDFEAAPHRHAIDGGDDRLVAIEPRGEAGEARSIPAALAAGGLPFQVVAGAERLVAGAGDDSHPLLGIGGEVVEDVVQLIMRVGVQCVVHFRA